MTDTDDDTDTCVYCGHPIEDHHCNGCDQCGCGMDPDFHCPDPPRGDE